MTKDTIYKIRIVRGSLMDEKILDKFRPTTIQKFDDEWKSVEEVLVTKSQIMELQKSMIKHYAGSVAPWYMDGYEKDNVRNVIVAFGVDDGEDGKVFTCARNDDATLKSIIAYGMSKGIPREQLDFIDVDF